VTALDRCFERVCGRSQPTEGTLALARSEPGSGPPTVLGPIQTQVRGSKLGPVAPPTEWALQHIIAEGAFPDAHQLSRVSGGT
jgi:hypothetical protein